MYRPSPDRTTQQNRWTEREGERKTEREVYGGRQKGLVSVYVCIVGVKMQVCR